MSQLKVYRSSYEHTQKPVMDTPACSRVADFKNLDHKVWAESNIFFLAAVINEIKLI